ncbi:MAG: phosphoenolpyruvate carboxykinase [Thermoleophilia bacterium]|nr:phosphoenolpyruvate carboxykinase [Thermoleophilia bacterium]
MSPTLVRDLPVARNVQVNPTAAALRELADAMPNAQQTEFGNVNLQTRVVSRSKLSTFLVSEAPIGTHQVMSRVDFDREAARQDAYIAEQDMVLVEGWIGNDPKYRVPARLYVEASNGNIAGMQQQLYFEPGAHGELDQPVLTVIYTPNLTAPGFPDDRLIATDLESGVTRVFNSDYFGESKKGNLRQWNRLVYDRGGIPLHAGAKVIPTPNGNRTAMIVGLSGTGKTTTTFTKQNGSLPVQDDFLAWWPNGDVSATEAGCFAKTFALSAEDEPTIHGASTRAEAYLENVSQDEQGNVDFFDTSYTQNGRSTFSFSTIEAADAREMANASILLILNKNDNVIPAVSKLTNEQAAAFFQLGETTGTSAGGSSEEGKFLRVPGTNPFFPMPHGLQGNRFLELMQQNPLEVYVLNTGRVGGKDDEVGSLKVRIPHSSAIVKAIAEGTIEWKQDEDFGYQIAARVPGIEGANAAILDPKALYAKLDRAEEYSKWVTRLKAERHAFLATFPELRDEIKNAV